MKIEIDTEKLKTRIADLEAALRELRNKRTAATAEPIPDFSDCKCPGELQPCIRVTDDFVMDLCDCCESCREICGKRVNSRLKL